MLRPNAVLTHPLFLLFTGICIGLCVTIFSNINIYEPSPIQGNEIAEKLKKEVRVLCWILTGPENHRKKAIHVKRTWGKRFNKFLMMSSAEDNTIGTIGLANVSEGREWLWAKTKAAFAYVWEHHRDEADWFMKADDDTFVVVENLRKFLQDKCPSDPLYFGCPFDIEQNVPVYGAGGPGYVLSKEALRMFVEVGLPNSTICRSDHEGAEDMEMGISLHKLGIYMNDSRDVWGRFRFLPLNPSCHLFPDEERDLSYWKNLLHPQEQGLQGSANDAISFHYVKPQEMYVFEYFLYHLRPYGFNKEVQIF